MSSTTENQVRYASIEPLLKDAKKDSLVILDWHVCPSWNTVLPAVETPTETAKETETIIRFGEVFSRPLRKLTAPSNFERLGACGSGDITAIPGERSFTTALIRALANLLEKFRKEGSQPPSFCLKLRSPRIATRTNILLL